MRRTLLVVAGWLVGCAGPPGATARGADTVAPVGAGVPCNVPVPDVGEAWRLVSATGFTFCVPGSWQPVGSRMWRGNGSLSWGGSAPRRGGGGVSVGRATGGQPLPPELEASPGARRSVEQVDGKSVVIEELVVDGKRLRTATWQSPTLRMEAEGGNSAAGELHLAIFRTVRFGTP